MHCDTKGDQKQPQRASLMAPREESACQRRRHGLNPRSGRSHMPQAQLSPFATTIEPVLESMGTSTTEPTHPRACVPQKESPQQ